MVGDEDAVAADIDRAQRVLRVHDPFDDQRAREDLAVGLEILPGLRVEWAGGRGEFVDFLGV